MRRHLVLLLLIFVLALTPNIGAAQNYYPIRSDTLKQFEKTILKNYGGDTVYSLRDLKSGVELSAVSGKKPVVPASVQKLVTTYAALKELGGEFRFHTDFIYSEKPSPTLTVKGYGDPLMTDERLYKAVDDLYRSGIRKIQKVILDNSAFQNPKPKTGINPYQAAQSAINFNFNTVNVRAQLVGDKKVFSTTSFSPLEFNPKIKTGKYSSVAFSEKSNDVYLELDSQSTSVEDNYAVDDPVQYFGNALLNLLQMRGIECPKGYSIGVAPTTDSIPVVISYSKDLASILADMNRYSSNFLANQILYQLGSDGEDHFSFELGLKTLINYIEGDANLSDASGLSRENRITASGLTILIARMMSDRSIAPDFQASLSRFGKRGTLRRRELDFPGEEKIWAKTGSLDGVSSIAGTIELKDTSVAVFAIITNGPISKAESTIREDFILRSFLAATINSNE
jgi:D-alanyl-D-alanine carboxypeptidase/D-alanyl-D-alanine-endopeptidase (penicillin-binding protein 4)